MDKIFVIFGVMIAVVGLIQAISKKSEKSKGKSAAWQDATPIKVPASVPQGRQSYEGQPAFGSRSKPSYEGRPTTVSQTSPKSVGLQRSEMERDRLVKAGTKATAAGASAKSKSVNQNTPETEPVMEKVDSHVETNENAKRFIAALQKQPLLVQGITMSEILNKPLCDRQ